ncbi:hypothetical protein KSD_96660 [Ktedonobacter sp. SOSP1-85]|nr:hypothetical protein KSD_96660 [Ktedonobacter sp. SOSP1-85]
MVQLFSFLDDTFKHPFSSLSLRRLEAEKGHWRVPHHLGIIMDGNRRFASQLHGRDTAIVFSL